MKQATNNRSSVSRTKFREVAEVLVAEMKAKGIDASIETEYSVTVADGTYFKAIDIVRKNKARRTIAARLGATKNGS